jgi:hypothetical protein
VDREKLENFTYDLARKITGCLSSGIADTKLQLNILSKTTGLTAENKAIIEQHRQLLINSPDLKENIDKLLNSIKDKKQT